MLLIYLTSIMIIIIIIQKNNLLSFLSLYIQPRKFMFFQLSVCSTNDNAAKPRVAFGLNVGKACVPENQKYSNGLGFRIIHKYI